MNIAAFREWFWAGTPSRRLFVHLIVSAVVIALTVGVQGGPESLKLLALFISWDFGAWYMDRMYSARLGPRRPAAVQ